MAMDSKLTFLSNTLADMKIESNNMPSSAKCIQMKNGVDNKRIIIKMKNGRHIGKKEEHHLEQASQVQRDLCDATYNLQERNRRAREECQDEEAHIKQCQEMRCVVNTPFPHAKKIIKSVKTTDLLNVNLTTTKKAKNTSRSLLLQVHVF